MKKFILIISLLLLLGCRHKKEQKEHYVIIDKNTTISNEYKDLLQRYIQYWNCMSQKKFQCSYKYELPHQRFLHSYHWYKQFNSGNRKNYKIKILQIITKEKDIAIIKSKFISKKENISYIFFDKWYNIDKLWFHKMKVSILPYSDNED